MEVDYCGDHCFFARDCVFTHLLQHQPLPLDHFISDISEVILLDISEFNLFKIFEELKILIEKNNYQTEIIPYLADIKDSNHISQILSK